MPETHVCLGQGATGRDRVVLSQGTSRTNLTLIHGTNKIERMEVGNVLQGISNAADQVVLFDDGHGHGYSDGDRTA